MRKTILAAVLTSVLIPGYAVASKIFIPEQSLLGAESPVSPPQSCSKNTNKMFSFLKKCLSWAALQTWLHSTLFL